MSIELIKAIYESQAPLSHNDHFYHKALQDIEHDGIASQVYVLLKQQGRLEQTPSFFQAWLKENYDKGLYQNLLIKNQTDLILKTFEDHGLDVVPLKGVYFAEKFFGHIGARATSDIDILIKYQDLEKAVQSIRILGFSVEEPEIPGHFHCSFSKQLPYSTMPLVVELHWSLIKENTSSFDIDDLWDKAKPVEFFSRIKELSPNYTFYMICLHGWRHNLDSMKYFLDIIQVLNKYREEIDFEEIFTCAAYHQTLTRMIRTLSIVYQQFPHLNNMKNLPFKKKKNLWKYRPEKGIKQYIDFIDYQFFSFDSTKHSLVEFVNWIWPSQYELSSQVDTQKGLKVYLALYKKRVSSMVKAIFFH